MPRSGLDHEEDFLFAEHNRQVLAYALRRCEQRADAEDVVAGTFAVAWQRFADAPEEELRLAWLYAIAARVLANQRRSPRRLAALRSRLRALPAVPTEDGGELVDVVAALRELRPDDREVLRLSGVGGAQRRGTRRRARLHGKRRDDPPPSSAQAPRGATRERRARCRTFSGWRHHMTDRDVMTLLADANPVRVDDLAQMDFPDLARRRSDGRLQLVAAAAVVAAGAAASIAVFAFPSSHPILGHGPGALGRLTTGSSWQTIALSDASTALGAQVVLPNTDFVQPSDAAPQARTPGCSADSCAIFVSFPAQSLGISYTRPAPFADPSAHWAADVRTAPAHHAEAQLVDLNGVPGDYIDYPGVKRLVEFVAGGTWIVVGGAGDYDESTLQAVAQSIVDQEAPPSEPLGIASPPTIDRPLPIGGNQVSLSAASVAFGAPIVQPETSVVSPSDAGTVWLAGDPQFTTVAVTYPRADVWVDYTWPVSYDGGYDDRLLRYHTHSPMTRTALLDGVPAQVVFHSWRTRRWSGFYPSVHFAAGGVNVAVWGHQDKTALEAIARSMVARSEAPPAGQLGNVAGVQVYPYLGHGKQISLSSASARLGSPVVLPDSPLAPASGAQAWAEGTCPHPGATPATTEVCAVWISFPGSNLSVGYIRPPAYLGTGSEWRLQARGLRSHGSAVHLDGVPALSIHRNPGAGYPGRVELDLGGTRVVVSGDYSPARLQEVARSIVDRSRP